MLLGSGVSRAAGMPTGWEVTLDLVRKLADLNREACDPSPEEWYRQKYGTPPNYSHLLEQLANTPSERQQLLRKYWEPTPSEREENKKQPTAAHRAIAALAAKGYVRAIMTTNFDRLVETALSDAGVVPTVMSSPDQVQGALPLIHTACCVFKIHGDYLDARIRNTGRELSEYPPEFDHLLDRILDEFGLLVCGWSAEWDEALRAAIYRAPSRRFTTYWAIRNAVGDEARKLIEHRNAKTVEIQDADSFFVNVQDLVQSISEVQRPHPLSSQVAVASLKRYLADNRYRIRLSDLVTGVVDRAWEATSPAAFPVSGPVDHESATRRVRSYDAVCSTLAAIATVGAAWADAPHYRLWCQALERLGAERSTGGTVFWLELARYPAVLLFYSLGLGAVSMERLGFLAEMLTTRLASRDQKKRPAVQVLPPFCLFGAGGRVMQMLEGMKDRNTPLNDWIHTVLRSHTEGVVPNDQYDVCFDRFEILVALNFIYVRTKAGGNEWFPCGRFLHRRDSRARIIQEINESIETKGEDSPFVKSRLIGETTEVAQVTLQRFATGIDKWSWGMWT